MRKVSKAISQRARREAIKERRASERGRRLPFTIKNVAKRLVHPSDEDRRKVGHKKG